MIKDLTLPNKRSQLLMFLHEKGPVSQAEAARNLSVSPAAVNVHIKSLKKTGLIQKKVDTTSNVGRPGHLLSIDKTTNLTLSIVFDSQICSVGLADFSGKFLKSNAIDLNEISQVSMLMKQIFKNVSDYVEFAHAGGFRIRFACVACPGLLDPKTGKVLKSINIPVIDGVDFEAELKQRFGIDSHVISESIAHFWGEFDGYAGDAECMMINWCVGIGCTVGNGHRITYPSPFVSGMRGEIGHVIVEPDGRMCKCGQRGCLEVYAGGDSLVSRLRETGEREYENFTYKKLIKAARDGDSKVLDMIKEAAKMIGEVFFWPATLMSVKRIRLTGDLGSLEDIVIQPFKEGMLRRMSEDSIKSIDIESSHASQKLLMAGSHSLAAKFYFDDSILQTIRLES